MDRAKDVPIRADFFLQHILHGKTTSSQQSAQGLHVTWLPQLQIKELLRSPICCSHSVITSSVKSSVSLPYVIIRYWNRLRNLKITQTLLIDSSVNYSLVNLLMGFQLILLTYKSTFLSRRTKLIDQVYFIEYFELCFPFCLSKGNVRKCLFSFFIIAWWKCFLVFLIFCGIALQEKA